MMDLYIVDIVVENGILYPYFADTGHTNHSGNLFEVYVLSYSYKITSHVIHISFSYICAKNI